MVVADMEAGLEHLSWAGGTLRHVDVLLVVAEPQAKSLITAKRTIALARQLGIPRVCLIGSRAERPGDEERLEDFARQHDVEMLAVIPRDEAVVDADRVGACVLDTEPDSSAVAAIQRLAVVLEQGAASPAVA